jgi:membrane fusion protein (multidrug efflux system)
MTVPEQDGPKELGPSHDGYGSASRDGYIGVVARDRSPESAIDSLLFEQGKLRAEVDRLNAAAAKPPEPAPAKDKEPAKDDSSPGKPDAGKPDAGKPDASKDDKKEAPKEPFLKRAGNWTKAHPISTVAIPVLLVAVLVGGWFMWGYLQSYESTDDAQVDGHVNAISSRISGTVTAVYVENNQSVNQGKLAVQLDPRDYQVALSQQQANLAQAMANAGAQSPNIPITQLTQATGVSNTDLDITIARAGYLGEQQLVASALADLTQAEANAANAKAEEVRYRDLVEKEEVSREQYDQRLANTRAQIAIVAARRASADAAIKTVEQRSATLDQATSLAAQAKQNAVRQVDVQRATEASRQAAARISKAQMDQAALNLTYCMIYAPVAGIVGNKTVEIGAQVSVGQELFDVTPIDDVWVTANYKETQLRKMHAGQAVTIQVDTLGREFKGYIEDMPGATGARYSLLPPENATGNYVKVVQRLPVRIRFQPNQDGVNLLRVGMSVEPQVWLK